MFFHTLFAAFFCISHTKHVSFFGMKLFFTRYANRLREQGKLIGLREYDIVHIGAIPNIAKGGSAEGADVHAASIMKEYLNK